MTNNHNMKKILILAAATAVLCSCGSKNKYIVEGSIQGIGDKVYLFNDRNEVIDSAAVSNGSFRIRGKADIPHLAFLSDSRGQNANFGVMLVIEPGTIVLSDDAQNPSRKHVKGTPSNDGMDAYASASKTLIEEYRDSATTEERRKAIEEEYDRLAMTTLEQNHENLFGAMVLVKELSQDLSGQEILDEIAKFPAEIQQSSILARFKESAAMRIRTDTDKPYIDIVQPDAAGEPVAMKSVVENPANKYVLLDFWASWCGPCMGEVPHLKKTYDAFHEKGFEIYGVSFDQDRDKWLAAIEQNGMGWIHVSELNGFNNQAAKDYAIQGIPSNFLIDSQGRIVAKNLRGEALYEKIAELLSE